MKTQKQSATKLALIIGPPSPWESCRSITSNLLKSYEEAFHGKTFCYSYGGLKACSDTALQVARDIFDRKPQTLVFLDHAPHPFHLLSALDLLYENQPRPNLFFHVYGDFLLNAPLWKACEPILKAFSTSFTCASKRHVRLLSSLFKSSSALGVCPFPVDSKTFFPDQKARKEFRESIDVKEDDFALVYAGRISLQKNVDHLVQRFCELKMETDLPFKLILAGTYDDFGSPLFERQEPLGSSFQRIQGLLRSLPGKVRQDIFDLNDLSSEDLMRLYNAADTYVSLSLHHDEDFGMAPAEALCCGAPTLLTSWGGYGDFASSFPKDSQLIPVSFSTPKGHRMDWTIFRRTLIQSAIQPKEDFSFRQERAERCQSHLSASAVAGQLSRLHDQSTFPFSGFTPRFDEVVERMKQRIPFPEGPSRDSFYGELYSAYIS